MRSRCSTPAACTSDPKRDFAKRAAAGGHKGHPLRLPPLLHAELNALAAKDPGSLSSEIKFLLGEALDRRWSRSRDTKHPNSR